MFEVAMVDEWRRLLSAGKRRLQKASKCFLEFHRGSGGLSNGRERLLVNVAPVHPTMLVDEDILAGMLLFHLDIFMS